LIYSLMIVMKKSISWMIYLLQTLKTKIC